MQKAILKGGKAGLLGMWNMLFYLILSFYIHPNMSRHNKQGYTSRAWHSGYTSSYKITEDKEGSAKLVLEWATTRYKVGPGSILLAILPLPLKVCKTILFKRAGINIAGFGLNSEGAGPRKSAKLFKSSSISRPFPGLRAGRAGALPPS